VGQGFESSLRTIHENPPIKGGLSWSASDRFGVEIKRMDAPTLTPSMRIALADLQLEQLTVVYPSKQSYELGSEVTVLPIDTAVAAGIDRIVRSDVHGGRHEITFLDQ
jgi:hypothetical protein